MLKHIKFYLVFLLSALITNVFAALTETTDEKIHHLRQIRHEIHVKQHLLKDQLRYANLALISKQQQINEINSTLIEEQNEYEKIKLLQQESNKELSDEQQFLTQHLQWLSKLKALQTFTVGTDTQSLEKINYCIHYFHSLNEKKLLLIGEIQQTLTTLNQTLDTISSEQKKLITLLKEKKSELLKLQMNEKGLQKLLVMLSIQSKNFNSSFEGQFGKLHWPVNGNILHKYNNLTEQKGVFFQTPLNQPVRALYKGNVIFANRLRGYGLILILDHGNHYMSLYAQNQKLTVKVGETVKTGQIIAVTNRAASSKSKPFYFEVRQNNQPINASDWISKTSSKKIGYNKNIR